MTNEESYRYWKHIYGLLKDFRVSYLEREKAREYLEWCEHTKNAYTALERQEKYRWHDLRKNPEDLPEKGTHIVYLYLFKRDGHGRSILGSGTCYYGRYLLDDWGAYKYIAWKEFGIEEFDPFEEKES